VGRTRGRPVIANLPAVQQAVHRLKATAARTLLEGVERPAEKYGLFLKAVSAVAGPHEGVQLVLLERRTDHELELAVVIGRKGHSIARANAMEYVAGYCS
jgi:2-keto-4-pentenoate hydratase/2-oxohepta-3-ene-1,7-dioic acid hydratase in catechol pathway